MTITPAWRRPNRTLAQSDPLFFNVVFLLHMDGSNNSTTFTDNSKYQLSTSVFGNAKISTAQSKWGGASGLFDGTNSYLTAAAPNMTGDWTIEFWAYPTTASQQTIVSFNSGGTSGINMWMNASRQLVIDNGVSGQSAFTGGTLTLNAWNHIAYVRSSTTTTGYINGSSVGSNTFTPSSTTTINVARYNGSPTYYFNGYLDDLRVTHNVARTIAASPLAPYPDE